MYNFFLLGADRLLLLWMYFSYLLCCLPANNIGLLPGRAPCNNRGYHCKLVSNGWEACFQSWIHQNISYRRGDPLYSSATKQNRVSSVYISSKMPHAYSFGERLANAKPCCFVRLILFLDRQSKWTPFAKYWILTQQHPVVKPYLLAHPYLSTIALCTTAYNINGPR
jgi:hypothetical protein